MSGGFYAHPVRSGWSYKILVLTIILLTMVLALSGCSGAAGSSTTSNSSGASSSTPSNVSFTKDVQPILDGRCSSCHGSQRASRGLDVTSYNTLMAGSSNGPVVVAGNPGNSLLIQMVQQGKMPKNGLKLQPAQIQILSQWISEGAPDN